MFQKFKTQWLGKLIDFDHVYGYQCIDLIKQYLFECYNLVPGSWGDAIKYWTNTNKVLLTKFDKVQGSAVREGDIVVKLPNHIGIATGRTTPTTVEILEQNGHTGNGKGGEQDEIRTRYIPRKTVAGILRPKPTASPSVDIVINKGTWNVRTGTGTNYGIIPNGPALGGQRYGAKITSNGWAQITFCGKVGYVGPAAYKKL